MQNRTALLLAAALLLNGCFFKQDPASSTPPAKTPQVGGAIDGLVTLVDIQGFSYKPNSTDVEVANIAGIIGTFSKFKPKKDVSVQSYKQDAVQRVRALYAAQAESLDEETGRANPCRSKVIPKTRAASSPYISLGRFGFQAPGAQSVTLVDLTDGNIYQKVVPEGFQQGDYKVAAEGSTDGSSFQTATPMPDSLTNPTANGSRFDNGPIVIKKTDGVNLQWDAAPNASKYDRVLFQMDADTADGQSTVMLGCMLKESDLATSASLTKWVLTPDNLSKFSATNKRGEIVLVRADLIVQSDPTIGQVEFHAIRQWQTLVSFQE